MMFLCEPRMFSLLGVYMFYGYTHINGIEKGLIKCGDCLLELWTTVEYASIAFPQVFLEGFNIKITKSEFGRWVGTGAKIRSWPYANGAFVFHYEELYP